MKFNVCIVRPDGYIHSSAFTELAELVCYGLQDLGYAAEVRENHLSSALNILIGCHLLSPAQMEGVPPSTIILNTEQIAKDRTLFSEAVMKWANKFEVWDYSRKNIEALCRLPSARTSFLPIGFHPRLKRIEKPARQDIDVLFYGSINERRAAVLEALRASGLIMKHVFGVYGAERDALVARSKVILNLHHFNSHIFEIVRVFYLMTNAKAVVTEVGPDTSIDSAYLGGVVGTTYDGLVECCMRVVADAALREQLEADALSTIERMPQAEMLRPLLA